MSINLRFINDLNKALAEKSRTTAMMKEAKLKAHKEKEREFNELQQKFNETLDESLVPKMQKLRDDMKKLDIQKVVNPYVSVKNDVCKELDEEVVRVGLQEKADKVAELREAYLAAIQDHIDALDTLKKDLDEFRKIAADVDPKIGNQVVTWTQSLYHSCFISIRERDNGLTKLEELIAKSSSASSGIGWAETHIQDEIRNANK